MHLEGTGNTLWTFLIALGWQLLGFTLPPTLQGQVSEGIPVRARIEINPSIASRQPALTRERDWESYLTVHSVGLHSLRDPLLRHEFLDPEERRRVEQLIDRHYSVVRNIIAASNWRDLTDADRTEVAAKISDLNLVSETELIEVLGAAKSDRLRQLILWQAIRHWGLPVLLYGSNLGNQLELTEDQREEVLEMSELVSVELEQQLYDFEANLVERISDRLDEGQRIRLAKIFASDEIARSIPPMSPDAILESLKREPRVASTIEEGQASEDSDGDKESVAQRQQDASLPICDARYRYDGNQLMLAHRVRTSLLKMTPAQLDEVDSLVEQTRQEIQQMRRSFAGEDSEDQKSRDRFMNNMQSLQQQVGDDLRREILDEEQRVKLESLHWLLLIRSRGPLSLLVEGSLGDELELSRRQKQSLVQSRDDLTEFVDQSIEEMHDSAFDRVLSILDRGQRRALESSLGDAPSRRVRGDINRLVEVMNFKLAK